MPKPKGGRGHTAPYETKLTRIPIPLAEQISELVERYQEYIAAGGEALSPPPLLDAMVEERTAVGIAFDKPVNELELEQELELLNQQLISNPHEWMSKAHDDYVISIQAKKIQFLEANLKLLKLELAYKKPVNRIKQL